MTNARGPCQFPVKQRIKTSARLLFLGVSAQSGHYLWPAALAAGRRVAWGGGYAIARVCRVRVILFAASSRFCPMAAIASWAWVLARPKYRARSRPKRRFIVPKHCSTLEAALRDQPVEALLGLPQRAAPRRLPHDPVAVCALERVAVGTACMGLVGHSPLRPGTFDHMPECGAFRRIGRGGVDAVYIAVLIDARDALVAERAFRSRLDPTRIRAGAEMHVRCVRGIPLGTVLRRINIGGGRAALVTTSACFSFNP